MSTPVAVIDISILIEEIEGLGLTSEDLLFRGQRCKGNLLPSIARGRESEDTSCLEKDLISQLRLSGTSLIPDNINTDLDLLVLAQHFGLRTRLLDWTSNPLAALWFACSDRDKGDVYLYALDYTKFQDKQVYEKSPFDHKKTRVFQPRLNNSRINAQHGWFTLHPFSTKTECFVPLERNVEIKKSIYEYVIPEGKRQHLLIQLDRLGVSERTLFPDLQGLCRYLNWRHIA